jgi:hypothetical protein
VLPFNDGGEYTFLTAEPGGDGAFIRTHAAIASGFVIHVPIFMPEVICTFLSVEGWKEYRVWSQKDKIEYEYGQSANVSS